MPPNSITPIQLPHISISSPSIISSSNRDERSLTLILIHRDVNPKLAETSWVYRLFGGQFRSRVSCGECGYNSDTFDTLLDLSVDVSRCTTLNEALHKFSAVERLEGKNKYKCEKYVAIDNTVDPFTDPTLLKFDLS